MSPQNISIRELEESDWQLFRDMRIKAVQAHPEYFLESADAARARPDNDWIEPLRKEDAVIFGLFDKDEMIGISGAFRSTDRKDTVNFGMSYIRPAYRGQSLSRLYYEKRLKWAKTLDGITRVVVAHREGNNVSRNANQNFGFRFFESREILFGDGTKGIDLYYELKI